MLGQSEGMTIALQVSAFKLGTNLTLKNMFSSSLRFQPQMDYE